jgi:DNA-binding response OmpR family regulator
MWRKTHPRILVVDDSVVAADGLAKLLQVWGYAAEVCYHGLAALEAARTYRPRVVLLDIGMPDMDGFQVAKHLREQPEFANTVLVGRSAYPDEAYRSLARLVGFDDYLVKPVDLDYLHALLGAATASGSKTSKAPRVGRRFPRNRGRPRNTYRR